MPGVCPSCDRIISASPWRSQPLSGVGSSRVIGMTSSDPSSTGGVAGVSSGMPSGLFHANQPASAARTAPAATAARSQRRREGGGADGVAAGRLASGIAAGAGSLPGAGSPAGAGSAAVGAGAGAGCPLPDSRTAARNW